MMAFRQECSAGRLVGFIWIVFEPQTQQDTSKSMASDSLDDSQNTVVDDTETWDAGSSSASIPHHPAITSSPATSFYTSSQPCPTNSPLTTRDNAHLEPEDINPTPKKKPLPTKKKMKLSGPIIPRQPKIKTEQKSFIEERPEQTAYYIWRPEGRGQVVVEESDYKRITELLLRLDFANLELATSSTTRWVSEVRSGAPSAEAEAWGQTVIGTKVTGVKTEVAAGSVNTLNVGLVRKKRKVGVDEPKEDAPVPAAPSVNVLGASMIRKKPKA